MFFPVNSILKFRRCFLKLQKRFQRQLAKYVAFKHARKMREQYLLIGAGSPLTYWNELQAKHTINLLDKISPRTGVEDIEPVKLKDDKIGPIWSFIDRWPVDSYVISAFSHLIKEELENIEDLKERERTVLLFSAHSLPHSVVNRGDPYLQGLWKSLSYITTLDEGSAEIAATVHAIMEKLEFQWCYRLVWQSIHGPGGWLRPSTEDTLYGLARLGYRHAVLIPVAFTSDHIETLYEMDVELCSDVGKKCGLTSVRRTKALNVHSSFVEGLANLVVRHLYSGQSCTKQFWLQCPNCTNDSCSRTRNFLEAQHHRVVQWTSDLVHFDEIN